MIIYESNRNYIRDVLHLTRSWTMQKVLVGVGIIGLYSVAACWPVAFYHLGDSIHLDPIVFSFLGIVLSILLVFRTNSAYDRWWEGRKQWGMLVNHCRNLAIQVEATFPPDDRESKKYIAVRIAAFCVALRDHLRDGAKLDELTSLEEEERAAYAGKEHVPNHIALELNKRIQSAYRSEQITGMDHLNIRVHTQALIDILGACERIKKTPIPFSYAVHIKIFILAYGILLPFALAPMFGMWAVPAVMFVFFAFLGLELMAEEIEGPFGLDCNDLPTGTLAATIKRNVYELLIPDEPCEGPVESKIYDKVF